MKQIKFFQSVGTKLFFIICCSILVCVLSQGIFSYYKSEKMIEKKVSAVGSQTIEQTAAKLDLLFQNYLNITTQISYDEEIQGIFSKLEQNTLAQSDEFELTQLLNKKFRSTFMKNTFVKGAALIPVKEGLPSLFGGLTHIDEKAVMSASWFQKTRELDGQVLWIPTQLKGFNSTNSKIAPSFAIAKLLKSSSSHQNLYVLFVEIDAEILRKQLKGIDLGKDSEIKIIDNQNTIIYSDSWDEIEKSAKAVPAIEGEDAVSGAFRAYNDDGDAILNIYQKFNLVDWRLVGMVPVVSLTEDAKQIRNLAWITAVIGALIAICIGFLVIRMIAAPLSQLSFLMNEGEKGNLNVRSTIKKQDEIGQLANSFNQMMTQINNLVNQTNYSAQEVLKTAGYLTNDSRRTMISAKEIAVSTEDIASGAKKLAIEVESGSGLARDVGIRMESMKNASIQIGISASEVEKASKTGINHMSILIQKTELTEETAGNMVKKIDRLKDSTRSVHKILTVLNNLTKQTKILSLNASIEASRAGSTGKGFIVIADEIRKLSDQSRESIDIVAQITNSIQDEIEETVGLLSKSYPIIQEQVESVKDANQMFLTVQGQMDGFIKHLDAVTDCVGHLDQAYVNLSEVMVNVSAVAEEASVNSEEVALLSNQQLSVSDHLVEISVDLEMLSNLLKESLSRFQIQS